MVTRGAEDESVWANDTVLLLGEGVVRPLTGGGLEEGLGRLDFSNAEERRRRLKYGVELR